MTDPTQRLSIGTLFRDAWGGMTVTWGMILFETAAFAWMPWFMGKAIDGLLVGDGAAFKVWIMGMGVLLLVATGRRFHDTRVFGTMRVRLSRDLIQRSQAHPVSVIHARALMGRELVDFMEAQLPETITALVQMIVSVALLLSFDPVLATSAGLTVVLICIIYGFSARTFLTIHQALNEQMEHQVSVLEKRDLRRVIRYFLGVRRQEVRLSDTEALVYGLIFMVLLSMLAFNLWFATTGNPTSPGVIFSIVTYSYQCVESSVALPVLFQSLTRLQEITDRINRDASPMTA